MAAETKVSVVKVKPEGTSLKDGGKHVVSQKRKIESSSSKQIRDKKSLISTNVVKSEVKETMASSSKSATKTTTVKVKSQKKVFTLPGQRYDPPEEREPLRIFYESLSEQLPSSQMAEFWMMEHGLLSPDRAKRAYDRKLKRQQQIRTGTPNKSSPKLERPQSSQKQQERQFKCQEENYEWE